jgi:2-phospho-L-lactate guanylyltransferase
MVWALLPVKDLVRAKTRLGGILAPHERRALAQAMLEDVLSALVDVPGLEGIQLVSDDPGAELLGHKYAIELTTEASLGCRGLNQVISATADYLQGRGVRDVMVMHCDLPLLQAGDVESLLELYQQPDTDIVLAPDLAGTGTNVMLFALDRRPCLSYGVGSCQAHLASAGEQGLRCELLRNPRLGLDVDQPGDLLHLYHELQSGVRGAHCAGVLLEARIAQRLAIMERSGLTAEAGMESNGAI